MFVLRYLYILALGVWLGGMAVAGFVAAPTIFSVLESWNPVEGRVLAGEVVGAILAQLHLIFYAAALVMLMTLTIRRLLGPRPVSYGIRASIIMLMFGLVLASGLGISPRVEAMQKEIGGSVAALPSTDPRRASFYQLHGLSNLLLSASAVGALVLVFWESRE
jgi:Ca2+/Na+ antiporter